ncbi:MAG TPA: PAS domain S-box protein, partial [Alphaproteobacteria bacterium]|nr:PAS domain S-box protein [Alphaproteobacteria bacterium]
MDQAAPQTAPSTEDRLRALLETTPDGVIMIDARGHILSFNTACQRLFGYGRDEVLGRNIKMLMPEPYRAAHDGYLHAYHTTGQAKIIGIGREVEGQRKDGSTFPMELSVGEAGQGADRHFIGIVRDLSARKAAEDALRAREAHL